MKQIIACLLIVLLLLQSTGVLLFQALNCYLVRCEMKHELQRNRTDWCYFRITETAYREALIDKKEMILGGKCYDIYTVETNGSNVKIKALHDIREEGLFTELEDFFGKHGRQSKEVLNKLLDFSDIYLCNRQLLFAVPDLTNQLYSLCFSMQPLTGFSSMKFLPPEVM
ncbi:MAG: hypothetical protein ABI772_03790 [Bacteroidota bacterium]